MAAIKRIYVRHYSDNGDTVAYVEWSDGSRTEACPDLMVRHHVGIYTFTFGQHMHALFARAKREGLKLERETW